MANKETILERLNAGKLLIGDGGYIIELERRGYVKAGAWTPEVTVEHPETVECLHKEFARAGSDVLQALTFYGNDNLEKTEFATELNAVNESACMIVKKVAEEYDCFWAGGLSPTTLYANGGLKEKVQQYFRAQAEIFVRYDADFLIVEYFHFCEEAEWAVETLNKTGKPIIASLCVGPDGDHHGISAEECAVRLIEAGADVIGVNCKFDPHESLKALAKMKVGVEKAGLKTHFIYQPLGFHCPDANKRHGYLALPEFPFALEPRLLTRWDVHKLARRAYNMGVRYIGGCCGFKAYHVRAISEEFEEERGKKAKNSEKHDPFARFLVSTDVKRVRDKEYWMKINASSGRPYSSSFSTSFDDEQRK